MNSGNILSVPVCIQLAPSSYSLVAVTDQQEFVSRAVKARFAPWAYEVFTHVC